MMFCTIQSQPLYATAHLAGNAYPDPDDTDPSTRDAVDSSEAPVGVRGDDG